MAPAQSVGRAFFPLDEELGLLGGGLTPRAEETLVRLASWMPFEQARAFLKDLLGVQVSKATARRATLGAGAAGLMVLEEEAQRLKQELPQAPRGAQKQAMSADGAMVLLVGGEWAFRYRFLGAVKQQCALVLVPDASVPVCAPADGVQKVAAVSWEP